MHMVLIHFVTSLFSEKGKGARESCHASPYRNGYTNGVSDWSVLDYIEAEKKMAAILMTILTNLFPCMHIVCISIQISLKLVSKCPPTRQQVITWTNCVMAIHLNKNDVLVAPKLSFWKLSVWAVSYFFQNDDILVSVDTSLGLD